MLASDVANPAFVGATDPDAALVVEFYYKAIQDIFKTSKAGRPIFSDVIYIKIDVPGVKDMQVDRPARSDDQKRFPRQYQHFVNRTQGDSREIGTPLTEWPILTRSQAEEFRALKFYTIESIANASDLNIGAIGMMGGMAPHMLREKARAFLQAAKDQALPQHQAEELAKRDAEIALLKEQMARVLAGQTNAAPQATVTPPQATAPSSSSPATAAPRKRGRPSKAELAARAAAQGT